MSLCRTGKAIDHKAEDVRQGQMRWVRLVRCGLLITEVDLFSAKINESPRRVMFRV